MRGFDRDLIRGGHYGQRSCEPHPKAEHMAAPTNAANVKKALANSEPSTHGRWTFSRKKFCSPDRTGKLLFALHGRSCQTGLLNAPKQVRDPKWWSTALNPRYPAHSALDCWPPS